MRTGFVIGVNAWPLAGEGGWARLLGNLAAAFSEGGGVRPWHVGDAVVPGHHLCIVGCLFDTSKLPFRRDWPLQSTWSLGSRGQAGKCEAEHPHPPRIWGPLVWLWSPGRAPLPPRGRPFSSVFRFKAPSWGQTGLHPCCSGGPLSNSPTSIPWPAPSLRVWGVSRLHSFWGPWLCGISAGPDLTRCLPEFLQCSDLLAASKYLFLYLFCYFKGSEGGKQLDVLDQGPSGTQCQKWLNE